LRDLSEIVSGSFTVKVVAKNQCFSGKNFLNDGGIINAEQ
jgi:hypothetical protein